MSDPDYRAMCAELLRSLENYPVQPSRDRDLCVRARAALAQSEPVAPTDEELLGLYGVATPSYHIEEYRRELDFARAVLARWGTPAIQPVPAPPTDEEIMELMPQQMRDDLAGVVWALAGFDRANVKAAGAMRIILNRHAVDHARAALAKWGHQ